MEKISADALANNQLQAITIPANVKAIGDGAFADNRLQKLGVRI